MECLSYLDYAFWTPILLWVGLYFWFYRCAYPIFLKKNLKKGKKWAYVPTKISKNSGKLVQLKLLTFVFSLVSSVGTAFTVCWVLFKTELAEPFYGFASIPLFFVASLIVYKAVMGKIAWIFQSAYYLEYRRVHYVADVKGVVQSEMDIHNKTIWSFTKKLRNAEAHGRLWKYVNSMASTKKIPPDIYAEMVYDNRK